MKRKLNGRAVVKELSPAEDPTSIGNLAIKKGYATPEQVVQAVRKQEARTPLGSILVEDGVITPAQLEDLLIEQEVARGGMNEYEAARFISDRKHEKMNEVASSLRAVATSLKTMSKA